MGLRFVTLISDTDRWACEECQTMRLKIAAIAMMSCLLCAFALAANVAADQQTIPANQSFVKDVELEAGVLFTYNWNSNVDLDFSIRDPQGVVVKSESSTDFDVDVLWPSTTGTYRLTWENENLVSAQLDYELQGMSVVEDALSFVFWMMIIAIIVIMVVVAIVVIVVVVGGKKKGAAQQPMGPPPLVVSQAAATGHCPTCGTALDPNASFCARCGTRYR